MVWFRIPQEIDQDSSSESLGAVKRVLSAWPSVNLKE